MIRLFFILISACLLVNCRGVSKPEGNNSSSSSQKSVSIALESISSFYNCKTEIFKGILIGTQNVRYIEIKSGGSPTIDMYGKKFLHLPASNMALLFHNNSKLKYDEIRVTITLKGEQYDYVVTKSDLEIANSYLESLKEISSLIDSGQFENVFSLMTEDVEKGLNKDAVIDFCTSLKQESGRVNSIQFQGFLITKEAEGRVLYLSCIEQREKKDTPFSIAILLDKKIRNIKTIRFSL